MALGIKNSWKYEKDLIYLYLTPIRVVALFDRSAIRYYPGRGFSIEKSHDLNKYDLLF